MHVRVPIFMNFNERNDDNRLTHLTIFFLKLFYISYYHMVIIKYNIVMYEWVSFQWSIKIFDDNGNDFILRIVSKMSKNLKL